MAVIYREILLPVTVVEAWELIARIDKVHHLISYIIDCQVIDDRRICKTVDGDTIDETILSLDHGLRRIAYMVDKSPFLVDTHVGTMQIQDKLMGTVLVWIMDVKPDSFIEQLEIIVDAEINILPEAFVTYFGKDNISIV